MNKLLAFTLLLFFISGSFVATFNPALATSELTENTWNTTAPMDHLRSNFGTILVEGKIYAIGGYAFYEDLTTNERYDPKTDKWTTLAPMPTARSNLLIVECRDKIYCIGGTVDDISILAPDPLAHYLNKVEAYDPVTNTWQSRASLPISVADMQAQVVNGQIFIITPKGELYAYNPIMDKWSSKTSLPTKEEPLQTHVVNDQLYIITQSILYMYNPTTDKWADKTDMPASMTYAFSVVMDNKIIVFDLFNISDIIWYTMYCAQLRVNIYNPITNTWHSGQISDENTFVLTHAWFTVDTTLGTYAPKNVYVLGLKADKENVLNVKPFTWVYDPIDDVWSTAAVTDTDPYTFGKTVVVDDIFYVIGSGYSNVKYIPKAYNPQGYHDNRPYVTPPSTPHATSPNHEQLWSFLTKTAIVATVLTVCVVTALFFYLKKKKNNSPVFRGSLQ
jgi:hypothetical protein